MRKSLNMICAALLVAGLGACNRGSGNSDEDRLNAAAVQLDNGVYDTSADDATLNQLPADENAAPANGANVAVPANNAAPANSVAGNRH